MESPRDIYKHLSQINNIKDIAHFIIFEKYIIQDLKGQDKLIEIESTDQEGLIRGLNGGYPIPGIIYTFIYKGEELIIEIANTKKEFLDHIPLIFCMNTGFGFFSGINLNMMPTESRLNFLDSYYKTFNIFFNKIEELTQNNKLALNKKFIELMKSGGGQKMLKIFNAKNRENFNFAYRKYLITNVKKLRMIEYNEWKYIFFYEPKNAFRKISQFLMHNLYRRSK